VSLAVGLPASLHAQGTGPTVLDPNLAVRTVVAGLTQPTALEFLGPDDFLILEKATGRVKRVTGGVVRGIVLDLAVNSGSERGLLGIALHPDFPTNRGVYLFWTESTTGADTDRARPDPRCWATGWTDSPGTGSG
jgi:glucose/arabinose dehydrogenase